MVSERTNTRKMVCEKKGNFGLLIPSLSESAKKVFGALLALGSASRPQLSDQTDLSKQTVSLAIEELEMSQLVEMTSSRQGHTGRSASVYEIGSKSGWILGVDFGSTHIRLAAIRLDGTLLIERDLSVAGSPNKANTDLADDARAAVRALTDELTDQHGPLYTVCVGLSRAAPRLKDWNSEEDEDDPQDVRSLLESLDIPSSVSFYAENNVNCAVVGEALSNPSQTLRYAAYLQIGVGIGAGIIADGKLLRGADGMAGELRFLPSPFFDDAASNAEEARSSRGIVARYNAGRNGEGDTDVISAKEVFERAARGLPHAIDMVRRLSSGLGLLLAALVAVANPRTIVLGGGVGQNPALLPLLADEARRLRLPVELRASGLGDSATVTGAAFLARSATLSNLLGSHYHPGPSPAGRRMQNIPPEARLSATAVRLGVRGD